MKRRRFLSSCWRPLLPILAVAFVIGCSDDDGSREGPGTLNTDDLAPVFDGVEEITPGDTSVQLTWTEATDPTGPVSYLVFLSETSGEFDFATPSYATSELSITIEGLVNCNRYYFVVRAEDGAGNVDENTVEMEGIPADVFCFFPEAPAPGQQEFAIVEAERAGDSFSVDVLCNGFASAYGVAFRLNFDPQVIAFETIEAGAALEGSGAVLRMLATEKPAGTLIAGISRSATMEGAEITDVAALCTLTFDIVGTGVTGISFVEDKSSVLNAGLQPEEASWHGGTLSVIKD